MPGEAITLGPFTGGVVTRANATSLQDDECQVAENFMIDRRGSLVSRPPFCKNSTLWSSYPEAPTLLCWVPMMNGITNTNVLISSTTNRTEAYFNGNSAANGHGMQIELGEGTWSYQSAVLYNGKIWFPPKTGVPDSGGWWNFNDAQGLIQRVEGMPPGLVIAGFKERLWIAGDTDNPDYLYYSVLNPTGTVSGEFTSNQFIRVNKGDGQQITMIVAYQDHLVIFKTDSTYILTYSNTIADGQLICISRTIGCESVYAWTINEDVLYIYHNSNVYALTDTTFTLINEDLWFTDVTDPAYIPAVKRSPTDVQIDLTADNVFPRASQVGQTPCLSSFEHMLIVVYFDKIYVYNLLSKVWTTWKSDFKPFQFMVRPRGPLDKHNYYAVTTESPTNRLISIISTWDNIRTEDFKCTFVSKVYTMDPSRYQKLFWWGAHLSTALGVTGSAKPASFTHVNTWGDLKGDNNEKTWDDARQHTWGNFQYDQAQIVDPVPSDGTDRIRKFYKFLRALRFKQIVFKIVMDSDGTNITGPQWLFAIIPVVRSAETLVAKVT